MAKEFLTLKRQTVVDIADAIRSKTNSDKAIKIDDLDDAIGKIESGGGGSAMLERPGNQPIPREGYIEKIKFNTDLSREEVVATLEKLEYDSDGYYNIFGPDTSATSGMYGCVGTTYDENDMPMYYIEAYSITDDISYLVFDSVVGWYSDQSTLDQYWSDYYVLPSNEVDVNCNLVPEAVYDNGYIAKNGLQNDLLVDWVYIPSESISKELTGTYTATDLEITEPGTIDVLPMIDNKEIPVSITVPKTEIYQEGGTVVPNDGTVINQVYFNVKLSNEEVNAILDELSYEDLGKTYLLDNADYNANMLIEVAKYPDGFAIYLRQGSGAYCIFSSTNTSGYGTDGWRSITSSFMQWDVETGCVNLFAYHDGQGQKTTNASWDYPCGAENDKILDLFSLTSNFGAPVQKNLSGTYKPIELRVTENSTIDVLEMIDNKEIPVSVKFRAQSLDLRGQYDSNALNTWGDLTKPISFNPVITYGWNLLRDCSEVTKIPPLTIASDEYNKVDMNFAFYNCNSLETIELSLWFNTWGSGSDWAYQEAFCNCYSLKALVIREFVSYKDENGAIAGYYGSLNDGAFSNCYHLDGTVDNRWNPTGAKDCYIYVPDNLVDQVKAGAEGFNGWEAYADQIKPLSEYQG